MATHDYVLDNASGAAFRTDLNNALAAIVSNNSNSSSPSTTYAYQWWADTSAGILKIRNSANNAWIDMLNLDGTFVFDLEDGSASTPALRFADDQDTGIFSPADNALAISNAGTESLRADSSRRLLINKIASTSSNGDSILQVASTSNDRTIAVHNFENDASGPYITLGKSRGTSVNSYTIVQDDDELGNIAFFAADGTDFSTEGARIQAEVDGSPSANDMPTRLVFATTADGANSPTERFRIGSSGNATISDGNLIIGTNGHGIDFSATGDASGMSNELLSDYEEGSWTPTASYGGSSFAAVNNAVCRYVKIGSLVHIAGRFSLTTGSSGELKIEGLPFAKGDPSNDGNAAGITVYIEAAASNITSDICGIVLDAATQFFIRRSGTTSSGNDMAGLVDSGTTLLVGGTYNTVA